jgi:hypothetical protein
MASDALERIPPNQLSLEQKQARSQRFIPVSYNAHREGEYQSNIDDPNSVFDLSQMSIANEGLCD